MHGLRSGTQKWYDEEAKRLNPICEGCGFALSGHYCNHATSMTKYDCHRRDFVNRHACPDPNNPLSILPPVQGKSKAAPKPNGQFGWFVGKTYECSTSHSNWDGCDNCGRSFKQYKSVWWGGHLVCENCEWKLRNGWTLDFDFDIDELKARLQNLHSKSTDIDKLAYDIETLYGENGYRRMSRSYQIIEWIMTTKVYAELYRDLLTANEQL